MLQSTVILVFGLATLSLVAANPNSARLLQWNRECQEELQFAPRPQMKLRNLTGEEKRLMFCYQGCMMRKRGTFSDGKIDTAEFCRVLRRFIGKFRDRGCPLVEQCAAEVEGIQDECQLAESFHDCFRGKLMEQNKDALDEYGPRSMSDEDSLQDE